MSLANRIDRDMVAALKAREALRLSTLRMAKAAIKNREIELRKSLDDAEVMKVLGTMIKQRDDAATQFAQGGRPELAAKERTEIGILEGYLPRSLSPDQIEATVRQAMAETGARDAKQMGAVIKAALAKFAAAGERADGKQVSDTARRLLAGS